METNRGIVEEAFKRWGAGEGSILDLMGDDGLVVLPGTGPHCGTKGKQEFVTEVATPFMSRFSKPPVPVPVKIMADVDDVVVVAEADGTTLDGKAYRNNYVFVLEFQKGRLMRATEFLDMAAFNAVWDSIPPEARAEHSSEQVSPVLTLEKSTTALIIIDLQKGILDPEPVPFGREPIVRQAAALGHAFAQAGAVIALTVTDFAPGYADAPKGLADSPWELPKAGLPIDFATLVPEIDALPAAIRVTKRQMSAFFGTELDVQLRRRDCKTVVICGVATNLGVEATAREAFDLNYSVVLASDACGSVAPGLHEFAMEKILPRVARVRQTSEILDALRS